MKLSTIERIRLLTDENTFQEFSQPVETANITGSGQINGKKVFILAHTHEVSEKKPDLFFSIQQQIALIEMAGKDLCPLILLVDLASHHTENSSHIPSDHARILAHRHGMGYTYFQLGRLSGKVPMVALLLGKVGASLSFPVAQCDIAIMVKDSGMSTGRPDAVKEMIGIKPEFEELAGARMHCTISGTGDILVDTEEEAIKMARKYLSYFPLNYRELLPFYPALPPDTSGIDLDYIIPKNPAFTFDMKKIIRELADRDTFLEIKELYAKEIITGFLLVEGKISGIIANNSKYRSGALFPESCKKMSKFISLCDSFGIPLVFLADVPGFMVGVEVEQAGIIKSGAFLFSTISRTTVPRLSVVIRKSFTAGVYAMAGPGFNPDEFLALPGASVSIYGRRTLEGLAKKRKLTPEEELMLKEIIEESENPQLLVNKELIDEIIDLKKLRGRISSFLNKGIHKIRDYPIPVTGV